MLLNNLNTKICLNIYKHLFSALLEANSWPWKNKFKCCLEKQEGCDNNEINRLDISCEKVSVIVC